MALKTPAFPPSDSSPSGPADDSSPVCILVFNANDPSAAAGLPADIATIASHYADRSGKHPALASPVRWLD